MLLVGTVETLCTETTVTVAGVGVLVGVASTTRLLVVRTDVSSKCGQVCRYIG